MRFKKSVSALCALSLVLNCMTATVSAYDIVFTDSNGEEQRASDKHYDRWYTTPEGELKTDAVHTLYHHYEGDCWNNGYDIYRCEDEGVSYFWQWNGLGGHKYVDTVVPPTYEHKGYTHHECSECGWSYDDGEVDMLKNDDDNTYTDEQGNVIERVSISPAVITLDKDYMLYSPKRTWDYEPEIVSVVLGDKKLNRGLDYIVTYENNSGLGTGVVIITGVGAYKDTARKEFLITDKEPVEREFGDVDGDGDTSVQDVLLIQQAIAGWELGISESVLDVDGDGQVSVDDAILIQQYIAGWDVARKV